MREVLVGYPALMSREMCLYNLDEVAIVDIEEHKSSVLLG